MSVKLMKIDGIYEFYGEREFLLDSIDDISKLPREGIRGSLDADDKTNEPCTVGSIAIVVDPASIYILSPSNEWKQL